jgi:hypothetical protein
MGGAFCKHSTAAQPPTNALDDDDGPRIVFTACFSLALILPASKPVLQKSGADTASSAWAFFLLLLIT